MSTLRTLCWKMSVPHNRRWYAMVIRFLCRRTLGKKVSKGRALSKNFTSREEALDVVEKAILFQDHGNKVERFAETIERIGFENVEKELIG